MPFVTGFRRNVQAMYLVNSD